MKLLLVMGWIVCSIMVVASESPADVKYVDAARLAGGNTGIDWANAYTNLQEALANTGSGTNLWIAQGTYYPTEGTDRGATFAMKSGVSLYGGFTNGMGSLAERDWLEHPAILSGDIDKDGLLDAGNSYHVVTASGTLSPMPVLDGVQIWHGYANGASPTNNGGGLHSSVAGQKIVNCAFIGNYAIGNGSALYLELFVADNTVISNCVFAANTGPSGSFLNRVDGTLIKNCLFLENGNSYTVIAQSDGTHSVDNCTFTGNSGIQVYVKWGGGLINVKNSILWGNPTSLNLGSSSSMSVYDSNAQGVSYSTTLVDQGGNLDEDPLFIGGPSPSGTWTHAPVYDAGSDRTTLTDTGATFSVDALRGTYLNSDASGRHLHYIISNNSTQLVVIGDASAVGLATKTYRVWDLHEQSEAGRWTFGDQWVNDAQTSPCIDAGDALADFSNEPLPNGSRLNMGAYGNTEQASKKEAPPPDPVEALVAVAANAEVLLAWENPLSGSLSGLLILRRDGAYPSATPVNGQTYIAGQSLGDATVVYAGIGADGDPGANNRWTNTTSVVNDTHYYYRVFAYDAAKQYSTGKGANTTPSIGSGMSPIYVDASATGDKNGSTWANAYTNLQTALVAATNGMQIWIAQGIYTPGDRRTDSFTVSRGIQVYGGFTNGMTHLNQRDWMEYPSVLSGDIGTLGTASDNSSRLLLATNHVVLDGLQAREAYGIDSSVYGAGLLVAGENIRVQNCVFAKNYTPGGGSAIGVIANGALISNCIVAAQSGSSAVLLSSVENTLVKNCLFLNNGCSLSLRSHSSVSPYNTVRNCTFTGNTGNQVYQEYGSSVISLDNSIVWGNTSSLSVGSAATMQVSYSDVEGFTGNATIINVVGNLNIDPQFVGGPTGTWTDNGVYDGGTGQTTLTDANAAFGLNSLRGKYLNPKSIQKHWYYIRSNTATEIVVLGDASAVGTDGTAYQVDDAHLRSQGYWTRGGWAQSSPHSPCIDAGDTNAVWTAEPTPNGKRLNMGAYGNTPEASHTIMCGTLIMVR